MIARCRLETEKTEIAQQSNDRLMDERWNLSKTIVDVIKAFDAANPPPAGFYTLERWVMEKLKRD